MYAKFQVAGFHYKRDVIVLSISSVYFYSDIYRSRWIGGFLPLMGGDEFALAILKIPKINCSIRNLYQGFRKSWVILLLTNIVDSPDVGQSPCRYIDNHYLSHIRRDEQRRILDRRAGRAPLGLKKKMGFVIVNFDSIARIYFEFSQHTMFTICILFTTLTTRL